MSNRDPAHWPRLDAGVLNCQVEAPVRIFQGEKHYRKKTEQRNFRCLPIPSFYLTQPYVKVLYVRYEEYS